jgi:hypothetical protein
MDAIALLLTTSFRHVIDAPTIEAGHARFNELAIEPIDAPTFCNVVATALRDKLIREPVRLTEGALQCHWHLELSPKGVAMARGLMHLPRSAGEVAGRSGAGVDTPLPSPGSFHSPTSPARGRGERRG